ncbi:MAG: DUF2846 domain-containing protein [Terriglobales bacterium]
MRKATFAIFSTAILLLSPFAFAQDLGAPGCGDANTKFAVKSDKSDKDQHAAKPEPGKALIYFLQDDSDFNSHPRPTSRIGIDGAWVGAMQSNSYFFYSVDPGVHHLCASWQTTVGPGSSHKSAAAHFTADANGVYYFVVKDTWWRDGGAPGIYLNPLDSDEGQLLANKFSYSTSRPK